MVAVGVEMVVATAVGGRNQILVELDAGAGDLREAVEMIATAGRWVPSHRGTAREDPCRILVAACEALALVQAVSRRMDRIA